VNESTEDYAGIVGYHTNADGSLEPVTGAQVYAWMCGVEVGGAHVEVQSGDKVWYKVDDGDEVTVLAVQSADDEGAVLTAQSEQPAGADGYIVARDLAYADQLGVKDEGTYEAYAVFDEDTGFVAESPAETTVSVTKAATKATPAATKGSVVKTGDFSLLVVCGLVVIAMLGAGALVLSLSRRRS
ncbi:MAG: hypothetical protein IJ111_14490, partial [Eggerthellaceae bacterium]|nr:hypothetical protein [Eggerthellaceae bacterium]